MKKLDKLQLEVYHNNMMDENNITMEDIKKYDALVDEKIKDIATYGVGLYVIIRTYSAGVHIGWLEQRSGKEVILRDARRMRRFVNLCDGDSLTHIAKNGISDESNISDTTKSILLECIEVIPVSALSKMTFEAQPYEVIK